MLILRNPASVPQVTDPEIRRLIVLRFAQVLAGEPYDCERHGYMVLVEPGDTVEQLEDATGCPILSDLLGERRYGDPDFTPAMEVIENHSACYELVFIFTDEGAGVEVFVPKSDGIDRELLSMCETYAISATEDIKP